MERKTFEHDLKNIEKTDYALEQLGREITNSVRNELSEATPDLELHIIEAPQVTGFDYGINLVKLAEDLGENSSELVKNLEMKINSQNYSFIEGVSASGSFLNFRLDMQRFGGTVLTQIFDQKDRYGNKTEGNGQKVVIDMSSPNIAKRMSIGHLRSTIIGDALANLYRSQGYEVIRDNHLGDWGTQFGKLIVAIKRWGNENEIFKSDDPIGVLQALYVKFHDESKKEAQVLRDKASLKAKQEGTGSIFGLNEAIENVGQEIMRRKKIGKSELDEKKVREDALDKVIVSYLDKEARDWFLRLEQGDREARRIWKLCVDLSMKEFNKIYEFLGVRFEKVLGESFYEPMLKSTIEKIRNSPISKESEGALVIDMNNVGLGTAIVQKSDGASVYFTRDLTGAIYRQEKLHANKVIYVVGDDQKQYFQQVFEALRRMGYPIGENSKHVYFGMIRLTEGKMSTREGRVILLKDVINEGLKRAENILKQKNPGLVRNKKLCDKVVRQIVVGALKWNDLSQNARKPIVFDWDKALRLEGNSAPYVQYTAVRANSILDSAGIKTGGFGIKLAVALGSFEDSTERALLRTLSDYPAALSEALRTSSPTKVSSYVYELAKRFNLFYTNVHVLKAGNASLRDSRLMLVSATFQVISNALGILGIEVPNKM